MRLQHRSPVKPASSAAPVDPLNRFGKLSAVYGLFFLVQTYGYAAGSSPDPRVAASVNEAVVSGISHLSHILAPFSRVAWPLGPVLCGLLVLYAVVLPTQFVQAEKNDVSKAFVRWFFALLLSLTLVSVGAITVLRDDQLFVGAITFRAATWVRFVETPVYLLLVVLYTVVARWLLGSRFDRFSAAVRRNEPWPDLVAVLAIAWLLMLTYIGAEFDGALDAASGVRV
jgi:hypothetical protein